MILKKWRKGFRSKELEVKPRLGGSVLVSCAINDDKTYLHIVMPENRLGWRFPHLMIFVSDLPRPYLLNVLKEHINRARHIENLLYPDLEEIVSVDPEFETYLDQVEKLPRDFQAVTTMLRLHKGNPHQKDFAKNLELAKKHHSRWAGIFLEDRNYSEMFMEPLGSQWGEQTWKDLSLIFTKFTYGAPNVQKNVLTDCKDPEYRRFINVLANAPEELYRGYSNFNLSLREVLENPPQDEGKYFLDRNWLLEIPLWDEDFRRSILDLTLYQIYRLYNLSQYTLDSNLEMWLFNANILREYRDRQATKERLLEFGSHTRQKLEEAGAPQEFINKICLQFDMDYPGSLWTNIVLSEYIETLPVDENLLEECHDVWRLLNEPKTWTTGDVFGHAYIFSELQRVTGSTVSALKLLKEASRSVIEVSAREWLNYISNYDELREIDFSIAITLLRCDDYPTGNYLFWPRYSDEQERAQED